MYTYVSELADDTDDEEDKELEDGVEDEELAV